MWAAGSPRLHTTLVAAVSKKSMLTTDPEARLGAAIRTRASSLGVGHLAVPWRFIRTRTGTMGEGRLSSSALSDGGDDRPVDLREHSRHPPAGGPQVEGIWGSMPTGLGLAELSQYQPTRA